MAGEVSSAITLNDVTTFRWFPVQLEELLHGPQGPVFRDLIKRGLLVATSAKQHARGRPGPNVRTGRLVNSITWRAGQDFHSPYVDVGTNVYYAPFLENGTRFMPKYPFLAPALQAARTTF